MQQAGRPREGCLPCSWLDHLSAQQELGHGGGADESEQRDQQGNVEINCGAVTDAQHQDGQHAVDVQGIQRQDAVFCSGATQQTDQRAEHRKGEAGQRKVDGIGKYRVHPKISIKGRS